MAFQICGTGKECRATQRTTPLSVAIDSAALLWVCSAVSRALLLQCSAMQFLPSNKAALPVTINPSTELDRVDSSNNRSLDPEFDFWSKAVRYSANEVEACPFFFSVSFSSDDRCRNGI